MDDGQGTSPQRDFSRARRIVIKIGSAVLAAEGTLDAASVARLADDAASLAALGRQVVLVSSGAVASGFRALGLTAPPRTINQKQAAAAVGQQRLMQAWAEAFGRHGRQVAQVLLTADDLDHRLRFLNARRTLDTLIAAAVVPIINENDSVSFEEIKLGDNDRLSALVAGLVGADLLLILSSVHGLYAGGRPGQIVPIVDDIDAALAHVSADKTATGVGGMGTKLQAAHLAASMGIPTVIASGLEHGTIARVLAGEHLGTFFPARRRSVASRKRWIGASARVRGGLVADDGAIQAVLTRGASLLPSGILSVRGTFAAGAVIEILDANGHPRARGLACYASDEIDRIKGRRTADIAAVLGYSYCDEVVHRDDMSLVEGAKP